MQPTTNNDLYDPVRDPDVKDYQAEVKARWGNTRAYAQSMKRVRGMTKAEMEKLKEDGKAFTQKLAQLADRDVKAPEVQAMIAKHHAGIKFFYDCDLAMYRNVGQMYVDDSRYGAYYEKFRPGLAVFVRDAIAYYCDTNKNNKR